MMMIICSFLLVILAILPTITKQQSIQSDPKPPDWSNCGVAIKCYCWNGKNLVTQQSAPTGTECDIGLQNLFFTEDSALFTLHIKIDHIVRANNELMLLQGDHELFGCKSDSIGAITLKADKATYVDPFRMALFTDGTRIDGSYFLCAVRVNLVSQLYDKSKSRIGLPLKMKYLSTAYEFELKGIDFFVGQAVKCNPYSFKDLFDRQGFHILPLKNKDRDVLECSQTYGKSYSMKYIKSEGEPVEMLQLECIPDPNSANSYIYQISEGDPENPTKTDVIDLDLYTFFCSANINEVCAKPAIVCEGDDCPHFTPGVKDRPATLTCKDKKWLIGGEYVVLEDEPVCKEDMVSNPNDAAFFIIRPSESEKKVDSGDRCFTNYNCALKSPLITNDGVVMGDDVVKCKNSSIDLTIRNFATNVSWTAKSITCEPSTGLWRNTTDGEAIEEGSEASCYNKTDYRDEEKANLTDEQVYLICFGIFAGILALIVISAGAAYVILVSLHTVEGKKGWMRKSKAEKFEKCEEIFVKGFKVSPFYGMRLMSGLEQLELLLATETEDARIWELVFMFLMRFNASIVKLDHQIWRMFNRYLYLQAKKIIEKHGWITKKLIRKKKQKGLMRAVAITLLTFTLSDPACSDSFEILEKGFRKLGFRGLKQYPHCGVMWSVIAHLRVPDYKGKDDGEVRSFDIDTFAATLRNIAIKQTMNMAKDQVIPEYGQVGDQAAFALGGIPKRRYHKKASLHKQKPEDFSLNYLSGMCKSLCLNPSNMVFPVCDMIDANEEELSKVQQAITKEKLNKVVDEAIKQVMYNSRELDAKRFEERFRPKVPQPSAMITELQIEQQQFEATMEKHLEEERAWFAAHTDKDELKAKPNYETLKGTLKLDSRIERADSTKMKTKSKKSKSTSEKSKDSKPSASTSSKNGPASPVATPAAAAAPAAAPPPAAAPAKP